MSRLSSWQPAVRIARRDVLRSRGRSALVMAMVGLPVALVTSLAVLYTTNEVSVAESVPLRMGTTQAELSSAGNLPVVQSPDGQRIQPQSTDAAAVPPPSPAALQRITGGRLLDLVTTSSSIRTDRGRTTADVLLVDAADARLRGMVAVLDGRLPRADDEVVVTREVATRIGQTLRLDDGAHPARVVGVIQVPNGFAGRLVVARPGLGLPVAADTAQHRYLVDSPKPVLWPQVQQLNALGVIALSRAVVDSPPVDWAATLPPGADLNDDSSSDTGTQAVLVLVIFSIVLEVVLLAGPAFAVGARRQARQLALVAASGGTPRDVRRVVLAQAGVLGVGAAVLGSGLGVAVAAIVAQVLPRVSTMQVGPFDIGWRYVGAAAALGALAALAAAVAPAVTASRADVVTVLAGRRSVAPARRGWPLAGAVLAAAGVGIALTRGTRAGGEFYVAAGTLLLVIGAIVAMPWIVTLVGRLGSRLPLPLRLAARDSARQRARTAPAVAAVMAAVAGVTALAIGASSDDAQSRRDYQPRTALGLTTVSAYGATTADWRTLDAIVTQNVPGRLLLPTGQLGSTDGTSPSFATYVRAAGCPALPPRDGAGKCAQWYLDAAAPPTYSSTSGVVASADALQQLGYTLDAAQRSVLDAGGVLLPVEQLIANGTASVTTYLDDGTHVTDVHVTRVKAAYLQPLRRSGMVTIDPIVTTPQGATSLGLAWSRTGGVLSGSAPLPTATQRRLTESLAGTVDNVDVYTERGFTEATGGILLALAITAGLVVLVGTLTATGLALADSRPDLATLAAVGARPRTRRVMAGAQALVIGLLGAGSGVLVGLVPGIAVTYPLTGSKLDTATGSSVPAPPLIVVPWLLLLAIAVAVPALAATTAGAAVRSRLPMTRRVAQ